MKLDFNIIIKELDGKPSAGGAKLSDSLASHIALKHLNLDPLKAWQWAQDLHKSGIIECDRSDAEAILSFIRAYDFPTYIKGQAIPIIADACLENKK